MVDGKRFDALTRALALRTSRRATIKSGIAVAASGVVAGKASLAAARRSSSSTTPPPSACSAGMTECGGGCCATEAACCDGICCDAGMGCCGGLCCSEEQCGWQSVVCCPAETVVCGADCCYEVRTVATPNVVTASAMARNVAVHMVRRYATEAVALLVSRAAVMAVATEFAQIRVRLAVQPATCATTAVVMRANLLSRWLL